MTIPGDAPAENVLPPELQFTSTPVDVETEPLFSIDGTVYSMPKRIRAAVALDALEAVASKGELAAAVGLLETVMGAGTYKALKECPGIDDQGLAAVLRIVMDKATGQLEQLKGE